MAVPIYDHDGWLKVIDAITATAAIELEICDAQHLAIVHEIRAGSTGGYASMKQALQSRAQAKTAGAKAIAASPGGAVRNTNVVTITTSAVHGLLVGDVVVVEDVAPVGATVFNGEWTVASVPSTTTFTYAQTAADDTGGGGTVYRTIEVPHAEGDNIKSSNQTASYRARFAYIQGYARLTCNVNATNGGTHSVWARAYRKE